MEAASVRLANVGNVLVNTSTKQVMIFETFSYRNTFHRPNLKVNAFYRNFYVAPLFCMWENEEKLLYCI